jgi:hypothetical protein
MSITEALKKTIDDLRLEERAEVISEDIDRLTSETLQKVGSYVATREEHINGLIDKVAATLDGRTEGRFAGEIGKVTDVAHRSVARLADQGPDTPA